MSVAKDFLVEIGAEELPPKALRSLMLAFGNNLETGLRENRLGFESVHAYASPRRLAVIVTALADAQEDQETHSKGPPAAIAFDDNGKPTAAAEAFARKCGVPVADLGREKTEKGEWLSHQSIDKGATSAELMPACVTAALEALPIPRRMRWGDSDIEFVRPVHWLVMLHGSNVIACDVLGVSAGRESRGHRFLAPGALEISAPSEYLSSLEERGFVIADFDARRARIEESVAAAAAECGGSVSASEALYDEVAALNEWPVALTGRFDDDFLALPREVIVATLTSHQRYFSVTGPDGDLLPVFITISNLASKDPEKVREGNERVIRPRLADAAFFWDSDRKEPLANWLPSLADIVYQKGLGSLADKSGRVAALAETIGSDLGADTKAARRAAQIAKCDLVSGMVGEFPELQGTMGRYYALASNEADVVADAIGEQYLPRFAGDALPQAAVSCSVALADKLDSLCGIFALGKKPSGNRDPFGLRRSALGLIRIVIENGLDLDFKKLVALSVAAQSVDAPDGTNDAVYDFIVDRLRAYFRERLGVTAEMFDAVRARRPDSLLDFDARVQAVAAFVELDSAASLASANKRIANILRKAEFSGSNNVDVDLLTDGAELALYESLVSTRDEVSPLLNNRSYTDALRRLADLRQNVDAFFDDVMVMADDDALRRNRLTLLAQLRDQFLDVADISRLSIGKG